MGSHDDKPWLSEPLDHLFESHGYVCHARRRTEVDTWCGYIYIPLTHTLFGVHYDDADLDVHGGLTYSEREGEAWCFGFDCAHYRDYAPAREKLYDEVGISNPFSETVWRSIDFVINELDNLAKQLKEREQ